jgi:hypothetical protein
MKKQVYLDHQVAASGYHLKKKKQRQVPMSMLVKALGWRQPPIVLSKPPSSEQLYVNARW